MAPNEMRIDRNRSDRDHIISVQSYSRVHDKAGSAMIRLHQTLLIVATLLGSWLGMQAIHESGHILGAWVTGGRVDHVVLHPLTISRTELSENPKPHFVVWAGPLCGIAAPLAFWALATLLWPTGAFVLRFFAGFCLLANGLYIGAGSFDRVGDCGEMLRHGSSLWHLWLFGVATAPAGLWLWHGQGTHFGFGGAKGNVSRRVTYIVVAVCLALAIVGVSV